MEILEIVKACTHILGAMIMSFLVGFLFLYIANWEFKRNQKQAIEDLSIALGVSEQELNKPEYEDMSLKIMRDKYSKDLFKNRLSDLCGLIRNVWSWFSVVVKVLFIASNIWFTFGDELENSQYAWILVGITLVSWIVSVIFSLLCKLFTGRLPGEAKAGRKTALNWIQNNATKDNF